MQEGDIKIFEGKRWGRRVRFELKMMGSSKSFLLFSYYKNGKLVKTFPISGTSLKQNGKTLELKYSGDAFGGPAFMSVDCRALTNAQFNEMITELWGK